MNELWASSMGLLARFFGEPRWLVLALAGLLAWPIARRLWRRRLLAIEAWSARSLWDRVLPGWSSRRASVAAVALAVGLLAVGLALARPRWGLVSERVERHGIDVVFVLDTSLSMAAVDVAPSRFLVAQALIRRLAAGLPGHRVALVQYEGEPLVLAPLTTDLAVLDLLLDAVEPGSLPVAGSRLVPALDAARQLFPPGAKKHRAIVVLSDGEDHGEALDATAEQLAQEGIVVSAFGIGTRAGSPLPEPAVTERSGRRPGPRGSRGPSDPDVKRDREGKVVVSRLHSEALDRLAARTGGVYLEVGSATIGPETVRERLNSLETRSLEEETINAREERFQWPLGLAAVALLVHLGCPAFRPAARRRRA